MEPRRPVASRAHRDHRVRCASTGGACCAATSTTLAPTCVCTPGSTATWPEPCGSRTRVDGELLDQHEQSLAGGLNEVDWNLDINEPRLWWPWTLGDQELTDVEVEISVDDAVSDSRSVRTGLREVVLQDWVFTINGEPLFVKGANLAPTKMALGDATPAELRRDVELAREAGLDLLRVHGHISRPELYDAADELGMLLWQDFPLQWGYARSIRKEAVRQAREAVDQLGHHPSIAVWCAHNEPVAANLDRDGADRQVAPCSTSPGSSCRRGTRRCSIDG